jgi:hypothetical protein
MIIFITTETGDAVPQWDVGSSTVNQFRVRTQVGGVATDSAISFSVVKRI